MCSRRGPRLREKTPASTSDLGPRSGPRGLKHSADHVATDGLRPLHAESLGCAHSVQDRRGLTLQEWEELSGVTTHCHAPPQTSIASCNADISSCVCVFQSCKIWSPSRQNVLLTGTVRVPLHDSEMPALVVVRFHPVWRPGSRKSN